MKERPILFSAPMVRAILEGRKTQTRRVVKPQPVLGDGGCWYPAPPRKPAHRALHYANEAHLRKGLAIDFCPYGQPGDRLWVRETWREVDVLNHLCIYRADKRDHCIAAIIDGQKMWKPSIHMPRWASRLTLEVTEVRVQRLQEISEEDARNEGARLLGPTGLEHGRYREAFRTLWDSINGERPGCSWADNPWVWAITLRRVE